MRWERVNGGNGHWYDVQLGSLLTNGVPGAIIFDEAYLSAEAQGGYLATITSAEENEFVFGLVDSPEFWIADSVGNYLGPWIGGWQKHGSTDPPADWRWVTGEPFVYSNWHPGEPNDLGGLTSEDRIIYFAYDNYATGPRSAFWNDENGRRRFTISHVVEFVPEPALPVLILPALFVLFRGKWSRVHP